MGCAVGHASAGWHLTSLALRRVVIPPIGAIGLLVLGSCRKAETASVGLAGVRITPAVAKPEFTLRDVRGRPFDFQRETRGKITLLFFGYTHCPDVCPLQMANIAAALKRSDRKVVRDVAVVFVTTDSARDSPQRLAQWLANFDSSFVGLIGTEQRVNAIQAGLKFLPQSVRDGAGPDYTIAHSAVVLAFTLDDSAHVLYPSGIEPTAWARDLALLAGTGSLPARP